MKLANGKYIFCTFQLLKTSLTFSVVKIKNKNEQNLFSFHNLSHCILHILLKKISYQYLNEFFLPRFKSKTIFQLNIEFN